MIQDDITHCRGVATKTRLLGQGCVPVQMHLREMGYNMHISDMRVTVHGLTGGIIGRASAPPAPPDSTPMHWPPLLVKQNSNQTS